MSNSSKDHSDGKLWLEPDALTELQEYQWDIPQYNDIAKQIYNIGILQELNEELWDKEQPTIH